VADALDTIPPELTRAMDNVVVLVDDRNADDPALLGLYEGVALTERTSDYGGVLPDRITIYREAILDICVDEDEVVDEVAVTVVHEVAHHFGIDEATLHRPGLGLTAYRNATLVYRNARLARSRRVRPVRRPP
jgi:predicted Zn-dependent protease with MMP-like domain